MTGASGRADDIRPYSFPSCFLCAFLFARQPHQQSAGGVYVAEEQPEVASYINSWPKNEPIQRFFTLNRPFFKELTDRMKGEFQFRFHSQGVENSFSTP